ncbi:unnamed protein product, partial [Heligmosomoides polygyrus]|uniref:Antifreeze protein n=1 Tax=Heligmosomoides polygyrus TaxID=6339 RepID=A0A183FB01_HELPZ
MLTLERIEYDASTTEAATNETAAATKTEKPNGDRQMPFGMPMRGEMT